MVAKKAKRKKINSKNYRSKQRLYRGLFAVVFGLIGALVLVHSFAASPSCPYSQNCSVALDPPLPACNANGYNMVLIADRSSSMNEAKPDGTIPATLVTNDYEQIVSGMIPSTSSHIAVINFGDISGGSYFITQGFTTDTTQLDKVIKEGEDDGGGATVYSSTFEAAYNLFKNVPNPSAPNLLIFASDGNLNLDPGVLPLAITDANNVKQQNVTIISVATGKYLDMDILRDMSNYNDGLANPPGVTTDGSGITNIVQTIARNCKLFGTKKGAGPPAHGPPSPSPSPNPSPNPGPDPSPNPNGGGNAPTGSSATSIGNTNKQSPTSSAQGTTTKQPQQTPSPFYDGKQYNPGSAVDPLHDVRAINSHGWTGWLVLILSLGVVGAGGAGFWWWKYKRK